MYVCVCHAVTDGQIRKAVDDGARSLLEVQCTLPVGGCCGSCRAPAERLIDQHLHDRTRPSA